MMMMMMKKEEEAAAAAVANSELPEDCYLATTQSKQPGGGHSSDTQSPSWVAPWIQAWVEKNSLCFSLIILKL